MASEQPIYLNAMSAANALGANWSEVSNALFAAKRDGLEQTRKLNDGREVPVGALGFDLGSLPHELAGWSSRNNRLVYHCLQPLLPDIAAARERFGANRIGVVIGTSTSGIDNSEYAVAEHLKSDTWPADYQFSRQELGDPSAFIAAATGIEGPYFSISTACTSGAKAIASAARLLRAGLCDAVIAGGVDTLCGLTLNGFSVLDSISAERCNPFSKKRNGINIGEGGALFLVTRDEAGLRVAGWGESADALHMSAPDPEGEGASLAIRRAIQAASI